MREAIRETHFSSVGEFPYREYLKTKKVIVIVLVLVKALPRAYR